MDKQLKLAWAAGFFDGEGYVSACIRNQKSNGKLYERLYIRIGINHVAPEPLEEITKLFGGNIIKVSKVIGNRKPRHQWKITTDSAFQALKQMLPYMKNKTNVAKLAIEFQKTMECERTRYRKLPEEVIKRRHEIRQEILRLNKLT